MKRYHLKTAAIKLLISPFILFYAVTDLHAEDTLSTLMQTMQSQTATKITYQETRTLELMEQPWEGRGYMYSLPPDLMIREQLQPKRLLMAIKADQMYYFEPDTGVRHQMTLDKDDPMSLNFVVFKALINADESLLREMYQVQFSSDQIGWEMSLKAKQDTESDFNIVVSGAALQQADKIVVRQDDGDMSEFTLNKEASGDEVKEAVLQLFKALSGE